MAWDRVVRNGLVFIDGGLVPLDLAVGDGRVAALGAPGSLDGTETVDAAGLWVLPGLFDAHFHTRGPAAPERETFTSGTASAAAGGTTTILEMPISSPPAIDAATIRSRRAVIERDALVDVGLYLGAATADEVELAAAVAEGVIAFKCFLQHVPTNRVEDLTGICIADDPTLLAVMRRLGRFGLPAAFHPEAESFYRVLTDELLAAGRHDGPAHSEARPDWVEAIAVAKLLALAEALGVHVHIPHVTSSMVVDLIRTARRRGAPVTAETCTHYLAFDRQALAEHGAFAACNPPFKSAADRDALWAGLLDGTLDMVTSDHAPFLPAEKAAAADDIWAAPPGIPGGEIRGPYVLSAVADGRLPLARAIDALATAPARVFGLGASKGSLRPGHDADLLLFDPTRPVTVDIGTWQSRSRGSATVWDGMALTGAVVSTWCRGRQVYADGRITAEPGHGRFVRPQ